MRILYQPSQSNPADYVQVDSRDWASIGQFPLHALSVQGLVFEGPDHYAVNDLGNGSIQVMVWHDSADWPDGFKWARVVTIRSLFPSLDPRLGNAYTTHHDHVIYAQAGIMPQFRQAYLGNPQVDLRDWTDFDPTLAVNPQSGVWRTERLHLAHQAVRNTPQWRSWTDGLPASEIDGNGLVKAGRPRGRYVIPDGTRTYYHNPGAGSSHHSGAGLMINPLGLTPDGVTPTVSSGIGGTGELTFVATTSGAEPDSAAWPTTGVYRYQLDVATAGVDLVFGCLTLGSGAGHFARASAVADLQTFPQDQAAFVGSGLHLASITNPAWTAGASTDLWECLQAAQRVAGHGNQTYTLNLGDADMWTDGPWPAASQPDDSNGIIMGMNF